MTIHIIRDGQMLEIGGKTDSQRRLVLEQPGRCGRISGRIFERGLLAKVPETTGNQDELKRIVRETEAFRVVRARNGLFLSAAIAAALAISGCDNSVADDTDSDSGTDVQEETDTDALEDDAGVPDVETDEADVPAEAVEDGAVDEGMEEDADTAEDSDVGEESGDAEAEVPGCTETVRDEAAAPLEGPEDMCGLPQLTTVTDRIIENAGPDCETPGEVGRFMQSWAVEVGPGASLDPAGLVCARGVDTRTPDGIRTIVMLGTDRLSTALSIAKSGTLYTGDVFSAGAGEPYIFIDEIGPAYATVNEYSAGSPASFRVYYGLDSADPEHSEVPRFINRALVAIRESSFAIRLVLIDTSTLMSEPAGEARPLLGREYSWNPRLDGTGRVFGWAWVDAAP